MGFRYFKSLLQGARFRADTSIAWPVFFYSLFLLIHKGAIQSESGMPEKAIEKDSPL
jgi:hypothetical protein